MSYFISHENWNIKTPFISYDESEFTKKIITNNSTVFNYFNNKNNKNNNNNNNKNNKNNKNNNNNNNNNKNNNNNNNKNNNNKQPSNQIKNYFINRKNNTFKKILLYFKNCIKKISMI